MTTTPSSLVQPRALAVDALRGFAILAMVLVAVQPAHIMPAWMYHAQEPPPSNALNEAIGGLTWPDLVFPFFLFTLGVAIPLAMSRRLEQDVPRARILLGVVQRFFFLLLFAYARQHLDMDQSGLQRPMVYVTALLGFGALFLIFARFPAGLSRRTTLAARAVGWAGLLLLLATLPGGMGYELRVDSILVTLAWSTLFGSLVWLATRQSHLTRLAVLAIVMTWRLSGWTGGWLAAVEKWTPAYDLYHFAHFQYLCIVIPGTIAGDILLAWMRERETPSGRRSWIMPQYAAVLIGALALVPIVLVGVQARELFTTTMVVVVLLVALLLVVRRPVDADSMLVHRLVGWGAFCLLFGLLLDPFDSGMKKIPGNFSWFYATTGLAFLLLAGLTVLTDIWKTRRGLRLFIENGQNPMIAYVAWEMLVGPLLHLLGMEKLTDAYATGHWPSIIVAVVSTLAVALVVQQFTRRKIIWRT